VSKALDTLRRLRDDFPIYAEKVLKIKDKAGKLSPFVLNRAQRYIHEQIELQRGKTGRIRALILKGRQQGVSTYTEGRFYWRASLNKGRTAFILTHEDKATQNLFGMAKRYHEHAPAQLRPQVGASNANELVFSVLDSRYAVGTARTTGVGRSFTAQFFHGSEVAYWANASEHAKGIMQAVPDLPDTEIILESTANGLGNYFHQQWHLAEAGKSEFIPIFVPWYWQDEYRASAPEGFSLDDKEREYARAYGLDLEQMVWRRRKIQALTVDGIDGEPAFRQEYPATASEAFQASVVGSLCSPDAVLAARKAVDVDSPYAALVIGVDPASGEGDDDTAVSVRQGRRVYSTTYYPEARPMEVVAMIAAWCIKGWQDQDGQYHKVDKVFLDKGGLGVGIYDRLRELHLASRVMAINFADSCDLKEDQERYANKRAMMWGLMAEWLNDAPVQIPDNDRLNTELLSVKRKSDSNQRLLLRSKQQMRQDGYPSPDGGDSLALTFAAQVVKQEYIQSVPAPEPVETY